MRGILRRLGGAGDTGASLVFVLVAVSILAVLLSSFSQALWGGFLAQKGYGDGERLSRSDTENALLAGATALQNPGILKGKARSGACYAANADGSAGSNYINYPPGTTYDPTRDPADESADQATARVFCTIYKAKASGSDLVQTNTQPDIGNGISVAEKLWVCGTGNYSVQGPVAVKGAIGLYGSKSDKSCDTAKTRATDCAAASATNIYTGVSSPTGGYCPGLYVSDAEPDDGTVKATACIPSSSGVWAETSAVCDDPAVSVTDDQKVPAAMPGTTLPAGLKVANLAGTSDPAGAAVTCDPGTATATLSPGVYNDALTEKPAPAPDEANGEVTRLLNGIGARTATCTQQGAALATAASNLSKKLDVAERSGFLPGESLTATDTATDLEYKFTIASDYVPRKGRGTLPVTPLSVGTAYPVTPVVVGRPMSALSVSATTSLTVRGTTRNNNTAVDLAAGSRTATKKGFVNGSATVHLAADPAFTPVVGQYIVGGPVNNGTTVSSVVDVAAVSADFTFAKDATVLTWPGTIDPGIYVGQSVTGPGLAANTTISAITGDYITLNPKTSSAQAGVTLTFAAHTTITMSAAAKANSDNATVSFYTPLPTAPAAGDYVTGLNVSPATLIASVTLAGTVPTDLVLTDRTAASGAATGDLTLHRTTVTGTATNGVSAASIGRTPAKYDTLDFALVGGASPDDTEAVINAAPCRITALASGNSAFTCTVITTSTLPAASLRFGGAAVLDVDSPVVTATTVAPGLTTKNGDIVQIDGTAISVLTDNHCTVTTAAAGGSPFTCTLDTAPTSADYSSGGGVIYEVAIIASASPVTGSRTCINVAGFWCRGAALAKISLASVVATAGSRNITITTKTDHKLTVGRWVTLAGLGGTFDPYTKGTWQVTAVGGPRAFTVTVTNTPLTNLSATNKGTAQPLAVLITSAVLTQGTFYVNLKNDWKVTNSGITITGGQMATGVLQNGDLNRCIPSYSGELDGLTTDDKAQLATQGVTLVFGGSKGLNWNAGNVDLCPVPVNVDEHRTDRPVTIYGPVTALSTSEADPATLPSYYGLGATTPVTIDARQLCKAADGANTCDIVYVPPSRTIGTDDSALMLRGAIFAPTSRVALALNFTNDDQFEMYGVVVNSLVAVVSAIPTGTKGCIARHGTGCSNGGKIAQMTPFFRFTVYECTVSYNGSSPCTQAVAPDASWVPAGQTFKFLEPGTKSITKPPIDVDAVEASGSTVTVTTKSPHLLMVGSSMTIRGVSPTGYAGTYRVSEIVSATQFKYGLPAALGSPPNRGGDAKVSWEPSSCPPYTVFPWAGCMTVKVDPSSVDSGVDFTITGPFGDPADCPDAVGTSGSCWAIVT